MWAKIFNNEKALAGRCVPNSYKKTLLNYKLQSFRNLVEKQKKGAVSRMFWRKLKKCRGAFICKRKKSKNFGPSFLLVLSSPEVSDLIFAKLFRNWSFFWQCVATILRNSFYSKLRFFAKRICNHSKKRWAKKVEFSTFSLSRWIRFFEKGWAEMKIRRELSAASQILTKKPCWITNFKVSSRGEKEKRGCFENVQAKAEEMPWGFYLST